MLTTELWQTIRRVEGQAMIFRFGLCLIARAAVAFLALGGPELSGGKPKVRQRWTVTRSLSAVP